MDQAVPVQVRQGVRQGQAEFEALRDGQPAPGAEVLPQSARDVPTRLRKWFLIVALYGVGALVFLRISDF